MHTDRFKLKHLRTKVIINIIYHEILNVSERVWGYSKTIYYFSHPSIKSFHMNKTYSNWMIATADKAKSENWSKS